MLSNKILKEIRNIRGLRPELEIRVKENDTFGEVINDSIDIERRSAANSALRRNKRYKLQVESMKL